MVMITPRPSRLPLEQLIPTPKLNETVAGEFWIIKRNGEDWPIIICDEEIIWTFFKGRIRPFNARQADGNWPEEYKKDGIRESQRCYPAVQLGPLRFTWVPWKMLEEFDKEMGQAIQASTGNEELAKGWGEAMLLYALEDPLPELKKIIRQQRLGKGGPKAPIGSKKIKRKGTPLFKHPLSPRVEEVDDEEPEDLFVQQGGGTSQQIKKEPGDLASFADMSVFERSTDLTRSGSEQPNKKSRLNTLGRSSMRPSTPLRATTQGLSSRHMSMSRATPASGLKKIVVDPDIVTIYVGNPYTTFGLRRSCLDASPHLSENLSHHPNVGWYVMSLTLSALDKKKFMPVGQYLMRGEYDPNIVDEGTEWVRLETTIGVQEDVSEEAIRSGIIYDTARTLELPGLQDLAFRKLKALAQNGPHRPFEILEVVDHVFKAAQPDMKKYLVEYLAGHFWNFVVAENRRFTEVMEADEELAKRVFSLLAGHPQTEVKNEADGNMKAEEPIGEGKDESASPATLVGDEAEDSLIGKGNSQELTLDYNGPIPHHRDEVTLTGIRKAAKDSAAKEKAERDTIKKMTTKELLADADAFIDQAASIISAANGTVSFGPEPDHATPATATTAEKEKAMKDRAEKEKAERDIAVRTTARELLANDDDNDAFADNAASTLFTEPNHKNVSTFDPYGYLIEEVKKEQEREEAEKKKNPHQELIDLCQKFRKEQEREEAEKEKEMKGLGLQKKGDVGGAGDKGVDLDGWSGWEGMN